MEWLLDRKLRRTVPHRMERCGSVRNPNSKQGLWTISDRRVTLYARADLKSEARLKAAEDHVLNAMKAAGNSCRERKWLLNEDALEAEPVGRVSSTDRHRNTDLSSVFPIF